VTVKIIEREVQKRIKVNSSEFWKALKEKGEVEVYLKRGEVIVLDAVLKCREKEECFKEIGKLLKKIANHEGLKGFLVVRTKRGEILVNKVIFSPID